MVAANRTEYFRAWRQANAERQDAVARARKEADPGKWAESARQRTAAYRARRTAAQKARDAEANRQFHADNPDYRRQWTEANRERAREYGRQWSQRNKAQLAAKASRRRGALLTDEAAEWVPVLLLDPCVYCGRAATSLDHIVPIAAGGDGAYDNLAPACGRCNSSKREKPLLTFLAGRR